MSAAPMTIATAPAAKPAVALRVAGIGKRYGSVDAVRKLSFEVAEGEVFGLLGPNGAGKTTTIAMIATQRAPSSGDALVFGHSARREPATVRQLVGVVPQEIALYPELTARENLRFFGRIYGVDAATLRARVEELLDLVGLAARGDDRVATFSGGMKRRLNLAAGLVHEPRLVLLDEPTAGVDPQSRDRLFDMVAHLRSRGTAVLYTTHYLEEAERLCDRLAIMDGGAIIAMGKLGELLDAAGFDEVIELRGLPAGVDLSALRAAPGVLRVEEGVGSVRLFVRHVGPLLGPLQQTVAPFGDQVTIEMASASLETLFLELTGRALRD